MPVYADLAPVPDGSAGGKSIEARKRTIGVFDWHRGMCLRLDRIPASAGGV